MLPRTSIVFLFLLSSLACADQLSGEEPPSFNKTSEAQGEESAETMDPLIRADDIVPKREEKTIGASVKAAAEDYAGSNTLGSLQAALSDEEALAATMATDSSRSRLREVAIAFVFELLVTLVLLGIAFQISGFPGIFPQLLSLSLAVGLAGAILDVLIHASPLNPIRALTGLAVLVVLIRQFTDVRYWSTAIKIAVITRLVTLAVMWLALVVLSALLRL